MLGNVTRYSPVPNNRGVLIKGGVARRITYTSINGKGEGVQIKGEGSENCSLSEVATRYH